MVRRASPAEPHRLIQSNYNDAVLLHFHFSAAVVAAYNPIKETGEGAAATASLVPAGGINKINKELSVHKLLYRLTHQGELSAWPASARYAAYNIGKDIDSMEFSYCEVRTRPDLASSFRSQVFPVTVSSMGAPPEW